MGVDGRSKRALSVDIDGIYVVASILLSGPAGANKSAIARQIIAEHPGLMVAADFQSIVVALLLLQRQPDGRYPIRPEAVLPLAEYIRRSIITAATAREIDVVATNSDGDAARRAFLLNTLGPTATERVEDPGRQVVTARLSDPTTGDLSPECEQAVSRWYERL